MSRRVLITGGACFIGSQAADELLSRGYAVRALDCLSPQVHGDRRERPDYLNPDVELIVGDVCDRDAVRQALRGVDAVFHLAAAAGVGQSMDAVEHYHFAAIPIDLLLRFEIDPASVTELALYDLGPRVERVNATPGADV